MEKDGGITWHWQDTPRHQSLFSIFFADAKNGIAVGVNGTILRTTNGGVTFIPNESKLTNPKEYVLSQNYPNPWNPSTSIRYTITKASLVIMKVYDILGNEIKSLVNEEKPAGTYEAIFNSANLPNGVYFYRIQAGSFVETKKMILLK